MKPLDIAHDWSEGPFSALAQLAANGGLTSEDHRKAAIVEITVFLGFIRVSPGIQDDEKPGLELLASMIAMMPVGVDFDRVHPTEMPGLADVHDMLTAEYVGDDECKGC